MNNKKIFDFTDYKRYLAHMEATNIHLQKGFRSRLSENIGCQNAFISQVLNGKANLSLEQSMRVATYLKLDAEEQQYFLWMVEYARAGTEELKNYFNNLLNQLRENYLRLQNRVDPDRALAEETKNIYYSHWYYAAIHVLATVPEFNTIEAIAKALRLNTSTVRDVVFFLVKIGLLKERGGKISAGPTQIHLDRSSIYITKHHANWRLKAIDSLDMSRQGDTHYSTISSLSQADVEVIRKKIAVFIEEYAEKIKPSKEETVYCFNIDFFKLIASEH